MILKKAFSFALDFVPIVGQIKQGVEAVAGHDLITDEELSPLERGASALGAIPLVGKVANVVKASEGVKGAVVAAKIASEAINEGSKAVEVAKDVVKTAKIAKEVKLTEEGVKTIAALTNICGKKDKAERTVRTIRRIKRDVNLGKDILDIFD